MFKPIRIRNDDVLVHSSGFTGREFTRFKGFHAIVCQDTEHFIHVPAILAKEIQEFPECISFIKEETAAGRMLPEVHGWEHKDYAKLSHTQITDELKTARRFVEDEFNFRPTFWYSPHGAGADQNGAHLRDAAMEAGLVLVTCQGVKHPSDLVNAVRKVKNDNLSVDKLVKDWQGQEILRHWWQGLGALNEFIRFFKERV